MKKEIFLGKGINLNQNNVFDSKGNDIFDLKELEEIYLDKSLTGNILINGISRSGKTTLLMELLKNSISQGKTVIYIDQKGSSDNDTIELINDFAIEANRQKEIRYIRPLEKSQSFSFNPIYDFTKEEIARLFQIIVENEEDLVKDFTYRCTLEIIDYLKNKNIDITIKNILDLFNLDSFWDILEESKSKRVTDLKEQKFLKIFSYINFSTINEFFKDEFGEIISGKENKITDDLNKNKGQIIILQVHSLKFKKKSDLLIKLFFNMILNTYSKKKTIPKANTEIYSDEIDETVYPYIENIYPNSKHFGLRFILSKQEDTWPRIIKENTDIKIKFRSHKDTYLQQLQQGEFYTRTKNNKNYLSKLEKINKPSYIFDTENYYSTEINDIYTSYKNLLHSKKLISIVRKGLKEIINLKLENEPSTNIKDKNLFIKHMKPEEIGIYSKINLKRHILNNVYIGMDKFIKIKDDSWQKEMELPLIALIFSHIGLSTRLKGGTLNKESFPEISAEYLSTLKEDKKIINRLEYLVRQQYPRTNRDKKNKEIAFINTTEYKTRTIELNIIENAEDKNSKKIFLYYLKELRNKKEQEQEKKEQQIKNNKYSIKKTENIIKIYRGNELKTIIIKNKITSISFLCTDKVNKYYSIGITLDNKQRIDLDLVTNDVKKEIEEIL